MTLSGRVTLIAILTVLLGGGIAFAAYGWLQEHDARLKAETQSGQQQKQIDALNQQQAETQKALDAKLAKTSAAAQPTGDRRQLVSDAANLLPNLPEPLQVQAAPANPALPNAPATREVVIPEADFKSIRDAQLTCQEDAAKLSACQATEQDATQQLKLAEAQRDEWKTAAKGARSGTAPWARPNGSRSAQAPEP